MEQVEHLVILTYARLALGLNVQGSPSWNDIFENVSVAGTFFYIEIPFFFKEFEQVIF